MSNLIRNKKIIWLFGFRFRSNLKKIKNLDFRIKQDKKPSILSSVCK